MATKSSAPSDPTDNKTPNPAPEPGEAAVTDQQDIDPQATKLTSTPSVFVNSEPIREDQVQNAVKFLAHPKVQGSPVIYRRSFLEKKGLTKEEIDEAFRRVPDQKPSAQPAGTNQASVQPQVAAQTHGPAVTATAGVVSSTGTMQRYRFHWSHALLAVGFLAATGAGATVLVKNAIIPRLKSWIRKIVLEEGDVPLKRKLLRPDLAEEAAAAAAAKAAAAAAADVAKASQEIFNSRNQEKRYFEEFMNLLDMQVKEMKSMSTALQKLEGHAITLGRVPSSDQEVQRNSVAGPKKPYVNGRSEIDSRSVRSSSSSPPAFAEPLAAPHPKSYMEIISMIQRGEKPPNIRDIDDSPPNPNQQLSNPRLAPRAKPWELRQAQNSLTQVLQSQNMSKELDSVVPGNGLSAQSNGDNSVPSWQHRSAKITDFDAEDGLKAGSLIVPNGQTVQRKWVPPQPPPVAMAEAAEAIRRPKPRVQKEQLASDELTPHSPEAKDELQRIMKISESGGAVEVNGENSLPNSVQIQEQEQNTDELHRIIKISESGGAMELNRENSAPSSVEIQEQQIGLDEN